MNELPSNKEKALQASQEAPAVRTHRRYKSGMEIVTKILLQGGITSQDGLTSLLVATAIIVYPQDKHTMMLDYQISPESLKSRLKVISQNPELRSALLSTLSTLDETRTIEIDPNTKLGEIIDNFRINRTKKAEAPINKPSTQTKPEVEPRDVSVADQTLHRILPKEGNFRPAYITEITNYKKNARNNIFAVVVEHSMRFPNLPFIMENIGEHAHVKRQRVQQIINKKDPEFKEMLDKAGLETYKQEDSRHWFVRKIQTQ